MYHVSGAVGHARPGLCGVTLGPECGASAAAAAEILGAVTGQAASCDPRICGSQRHPSIEGGGDERVSKTVGEIPLSIPTFFAAVHHSIRANLLR